MRFRKQEELQQSANSRQPTKALTSRPARLQGLSRYRDDIGVESDYIVVELARKRLGEVYSRL